MRLSAMLRNHPGSLLLLATALTSILLWGSPNARADVQTVSSLEDTNFRPGEVIIQLRNSGDSKRLTSAFAGSNLKPERLLSKRLNIWLYTYSDISLAASDRSALMENLRSSNEVEVAQFNHVLSQRATIPNDPSFTQQWSLNNTGQAGGTPDADIDAPEAWDNTTGGATVTGDSIVVAIIDGGFDLTHPDLRFFKNKEEIPGNGIDDDSNGYIDDYDGWNAYNHNGVIPLDNHGTHVAGIAGARGNNNLGISGVNWGLHIMAVAGSANTEATVVEAYGYVLEMRARYNQSNGAHGAYVVATNSSFGVDFGQPANYPLWCGMYDSMGVAGILSCAATANQAIDIDVNGDMPTACPSPYMVAVTNTTRTDTKNTGAAWGHTTIDLGAPGTSIYSTLPSASYGNLTGTSMASPHVAGAIALMYSAGCKSLIDLSKLNPGAVALQIKQYLLNGVDTIPALNGITVSNGRLNVNKSVLLVKSYNCGVQINHTPLPSTKHTASPYQVLCTISADTTLIPDSTLLWYQIGALWHSDTLLATANPDEYQGFIPAEPPGTAVHYYMRAQSYSGAADTTATFSFNVYSCGDADGNSMINISDVVFLVSYIFAGGPAPSPLDRADVNCDSTVNVSDAVYLIAFIFAGGPAACASCP